MKIRIEVTAEDIANGIRQAADSCPIALALRRACPQAGNVEVDGDGLIELEGVTYSSQFPTEAHEFVDNFDREVRSREPQPFSFEAEFDPRVYVYDDDYP